MVAMTALLTRLRDRGWNLTAQRRAVAEALEGDHMHLTIEEIHERATAALPEISRATVYNTVNELCTMGEVAEVSGDGRAKRYDPNADVDHQHLVCDRCGAIYDVTPAGTDTLRLRTAERHGFQLTGVEITFRGVCPDCRPKGRSAPPTDNPNHAP